MKISSFNKQVVVSLLFLLLVIFLISTYFLTRASKKTSSVSQNLTQTALSCTETLPVNFLVGQVLAVGIPARSFVEQASVFKQYNIGGAVLMSAPSDISDGSVKSFKTNASSLGVPVLISVDEEGGQIQRFRALGALPSPQEVASTFTAAQAQDLVAEHSKKLKEVGVDMVFGPLADVAPVNKLSVLGNRVFSSDPKVVSSFVKAYVSGWRSGGVIPVLKHFPGMGSASANTDYEPATTPSLDYLKERDFIPYKDSVNTSVAIMIGNQNVPGWFTGPASLSSLVNKYVRETLGYKDNLIVTDSLAAVAITSTISEEDAVVAAIVAGNDLILLVGPGSQVPSAGRLAKIEETVEKAVESGKISKKQLATSVSRKFSLQGVDACLLK